VASVRELATVCFRPLTDQEFSQLTRALPDEAVLRDKLERLKRQGGVDRDMDIGFLIAVLEKHVKQTTSVSRFAWPGSDARMREILSTLPTRLVCIGQAAIARSQRSAKSVQRSPFRFQGVWLQSDARLPYQPRLHFAPGIRAGFRAVDQHMNDGLPVTRPAGQSSARRSARTATLRCQSSACARRRQLSKNVALFRQIERRAGVVRAASPGLSDSNLMHSGASCHQAHDACNCIELRQRRWGEW
jgi:hypothetical protein